MEKENELLRLSQLKKEVYTKKAQEILDLHFLLQEDTKFKLENFLVRTLLDKNKIDYRIAPLKALMVTNLETSTYKNMIPIGDAGFINLFLRKIYGIYGKEIHINGIKNEPDNPVSKRQAEYLVYVINGYIASVNLYCGLIYPEYRMDYNQISQVVRTINENNPFLKSYVLKVGVSFGVTYLDEVYNFSSISVLETRMNELLLRAYQQGINFLIKTETLSKELK